MLLIVYDQKSGAVLFRRVFSPQGNVETILKSVSLDFANADGVEPRALIVDESCGPKSHRAITDEHGLAIVPKDYAGSPEVAFAADELRRVRSLLARSNLRRIVDAPASPLPLLPAQIAAPIPRSDGLVRDVGVIVRCHHQEEYLAECLASIFANNFPLTRKVLLIHDGCEKSNVADPWRERIDEEYVAFKNAALTANYAVLKMQTDWILFVDGDDWISENYLSALCARDTDPCAVIIYPSMWNFGTKENQWTAPPFDRDMLFEKNWIPMTSLVRRHVWMEAGGLDPKLSCYLDWDLWQRIVQRHYRATPCPDAIIHHRTHPSQLSDFHSAKTHADVIQKNARVLIVTAFDDKPDCIHAHCESIANLECDRAKLHVLFIDNSSEPRNQQAIQREMGQLASCCASVRLIPRHDLPPMDRSGTNLYTEQVSERMVDLYRAVPWETDCEFIWMYENDVLAEPDALNLMVRAMQPKVAAVSGCVMRKPKPGETESRGLQAWQFGQSAASNATLLNFDESVRADGLGGDPVPIGASSFSCVLIRTAIWRRTLLRATRPISAYDGKFGLDVRDMRYVYLLHPGVRCKHMVSSDQWV